jgi:Flp pilus assembly protein TadG
MQSVKSRTSVAMKKLRHRIAAQAPAGVGETDQTPSRHFGRLLKHLRRQEGSALLEAALTFGIVMLLLFGAVEFSYAFYAYQDVADAARQASRWASVRGSTSCANVPGLSGCGASSGDIQTYVQNLAYAGIVTANLNTSVTWLSASTSTPTTWSACATPCKSPGNQVQVTVSYAFPLAVPYWKASTINFSSTGSMVIAQ